MKNASLLALLIPVLGFVQPAAAQQAESVPLAIDVVERWQSDQRLYVKGNLGISTQNLTSLERWLDENGPHWTVVLVQDTQGEAYRAADGRAYVGMDAVEVALGHGLGNRTKFGELEHPKTGETDGAVFVLFLAERKFSYFGSDAHDRRGLGESHWVGELDRPAIRAMQGGGRILDAVKDTVQSINRRLDRAIATEAEQAERREAQRERDLNEVKMSVEAARESMQKVAEQLSQLRLAHPEANGEMATPPIDAWANKLAAIETQLNDETVREQTQATSDVTADISRYLNWFAEHVAFNTRNKAFAESVTKLRQYPNRVAAPMADNADSLLKQAASQQATGDPEFLATLAKIESQLKEGQSAGRAEQKRLEAAAARRRLIRNSVLATLALAALVLIGVLVFLNRRRAKTKTDVVKSFREREHSVRKEMDNVVKLFNRSGEILGTKEKIEKRGYGGNTKQLCHKAFQTVDELLIMSNEVDRVIDEARDLIHPKHWYGRLVNTFSGSRYERGLNRISGEPLTFHENQGIPAILKPDSADGQSPESISLNFETVFSAFHDRTDTAAQTLNKIESALLEANDRLSGLQDRIDEASAVEKELAVQASEDDFFPVTEFFNTLIPSAQADHDQAADLAATDPVHIVDVEIPRGIRKLDDAIAISQAVEIARTDTFSQFDQHAPRLKEAGYDTSWVEATVRQYGDQANELFRSAAERPVGSNAKELEQSIRELGNRVERCAELAEDLQNSHEPELDSLHAAITAARDKICHRLKLSADQVLHEEDASPDMRLSSAQEQLIASRAALQHGDIDAAHAAAETLCDEVTTGHDIVSNSLAVLEEFRDEHRQHEQAYQSVRDSLPQFDQIVRTIEEQFSESAQRLRAGDPECPDEHATAGSRLREAGQSLDDNHRLLQDAASLFEQGRLLQASAAAQTAAGRNEHAAVLLGEIDAHAKRLEQQIKTNRESIQQLGRDARKLDGEVRELETTRTTILEYERLEQRFNAVEQQLSSAERDPFENAERLHTLQQDIQRVAAMLLADRNSYAEATRAVDGAVKELATALKFVEQAKRDGIPDSELTVRSVRETKQLEHQLDETRKRLRIPHDDWEEIDDRAARLNAELGTQSAQLRGELQMAERSVAELERASREVFAATRWTGGFGVNVLGSPGSGELDRARRALNQGDYQTMIQLSRAASMAAQFAIQQAQREMERRRREQERREEASRRAEAARRRQMTRPSINFGPKSGSSGGSISFGGGSSSRGSSPSGSGFSRSGW